MLYSILNSKIKTGAAQSYLTYIKPVICLLLCMAKACSLFSFCFQDLNSHLNDAQEQVAADDKLSNSALMKMLKGDPRSLVPLPSGCPSHHESFWTPPDTLTVEHLSQLIAQKQAQKRVPLLCLFLQNVRRVWIFKLKLYRICPTFWMELILKKW